MVCIIVKRTVMSTYSTVESPPGKHVPITDGHHGTTATCLYYGVIILSEVIFSSLMDPVLSGSSPCSLLLNDRRSRSLTEIEDEERGKSLSCYLRTCNMPFHYHM